MKSLLDVGLLDKFNAMIKKCVSKKNIKYLIDTILEESVKLIDVGYVRILFINSGIKRVYDEGGGGFQNYLNFN